MSVQPSMAWSRPATSRESYVVPNRTRLGWCSRTRSRAFVSSSSALESTFPGFTSAYTQMPATSDHLRFRQERDDALHARLGVLDDLAGALLRRVVDAGHVLGPFRVVAG